MCLTKHATLDEFIEKSEITDASKFWRFDAGKVMVVELPSSDHEVAHTQFTRQFLSSFGNVALQDDVDNIAGTSTCFYYFFFLLSKCYFYVRSDFGYFC